MSFTLPPEGLLVRLMPASESSSSSSSLSSPPPSQPDTTPRMLQITNADSNYVYVDNGKFITKDDTKIYNSSNPKDVFKVWKTYLHGNGSVMTESTKKDLIGKYVDVNQDEEKWRLLSDGGSRYSRKKSSKRIRSMKKVGSKFRKYSRRK